MWPTEKRIYEAKIYQFSECANYKYRLQGHTHLNQIKLAELVAVSTGLKFPDSEHKRAMAALDSAKKHCRHFYKAPLCRLVEVCGDDTMTFYNKDCVAEVHVILSEDEDEKDDEQAAAIRIHVPEAKKFKSTFWTSPDDSSTG